VSEAPVIRSGTDQVHSSVLLDATDSGRRLLQNGVVFLGVVGLMFAGAVLKKSIDGTAGAIGGTVAALSVLSMLTAFLIQIRWDVTYKGHRVRFENDPFRGERLSVDGKRIATGGLGRQTVLRGAIPDGDGAGDLLTATCTAGYVSFQCRIVVEPAPAAAAPDPGTR